MLKLEEIKSTEQLKNGDWILVKTENIAPSLLFVKSVVDDSINVLFNGSPHSFNFKEFKKGNTFIKEMKKVISA